MDIMNDEQNKKVFIIANASIAVSSTNPMQIKPHDTNFYNRQRYFSKLKMLSLLTT